MSVGTETLYKFSLQLFVYVSWGIHLTCINYLLPYSLIDMKFDEPISAALEAIFL